MGGPLHQSHRFNPRGWPKRSYLHLICKEYIVHREPLWFLCSAGHQNSRYILLILILHSNRTYSYCIEDWVGEGISGPAGRSLYTVILIKIKMKIKMCGCMALIKSLQSRMMDAGCRWGWGWGWWWEGQRRWQGMILGDVKNRSNGSLNKHMH